MKIKMKTFKEFLEKARMTKGQAIEETLFRFEEDGLKISANSGAQLSRVEAELRPEAFADYEAVGNLGVDKFGVFVKAVNRFSDTIEISKSGNLLTLKEDKKSVDIELVAEEYIEADREAPKFEYNEEFVISGDSLNKIFNDAQLNTDARIIIETKPNLVIFKNTGKFKFTNEFDAPKCKGGVKVKFGESIIDAISKLTGELTIKAKSDYPLTVIEEGDNSTIKIILAPMVDTGTVSKTKEEKKEAIPKEAIPKEESTLKDSKKESDEEGSSIEESDDSKDE